MKYQVLAQKYRPQDFDDVLMQMKGLVQDKLVISIAAGITTKHIENELGFVRVVRTMPNIAAKIGQAINEAMRAIEAENPGLKDVLPKSYNRLEDATLYEPVARGDGVRGRSASSC